MTAAWVRWSAVVALATGGCGSDPAPAQPSATAQTGTAGPERPLWPSWGGVAWPASDDALASELRAAELRRDATAEAIDRAWNHDDPRWRDAAARTLARIGGPEARERFERWLGDGRIELSAATLGAVALLAAPGAESTREEVWDSLEQRLWSRYAVTEDAREVEALQLAVARVGGARSSRLLAADLAEPPADEAVLRHVHGLEAQAILCTRGYALSDAALQVVARDLSDGRTPVADAAAYALARCAAVSAEQLAGEERSALVDRLAALVTSESARAARRAWWALEGLGALPTVVPPQILGAGTMDWQTEVAAVRALVAHADGRKVLARRVPKLVLDEFQGPRLHVLRELLERLRPFVAHEKELHEPLQVLLTALQSVRDRSEGPRARALTMLVCEAQLLRATHTGDPAPVRGCTRGDAGHGLPPTHGERLAIEAVVHMGSAMSLDDRRALLLERAADPRPEIAAPAVSALAGLDHPEVTVALREALAYRDMGVAAAAAGAIASRAADRSRRDPEAVPALAKILHDYENARAIETRIAAIDALGRLARSEPGAEDEGGPPPWLETSVLPLARDPAVAVRMAAREALRGHPALIERFDAAIPEVPPEAFEPAVHQAVDASAPATGLRLHTTRGPITIDFAGAPAPIAQANLAALASAGFFDGLVFHRVVPGFVIQGGDPRGDGYGGPGHVMPCEWSTLRYERGVVGIALAGKDTGGSQLFVTHDAATHLDARYTVIGRVAEGMEVVDTIWPHDGIERVEVLTEPAAGSEPSP